MFFGMLRVLGDLPEFCYDYSADISLNLAACYILLPAPTSPCLWINQFLLDFYTNTYIYIYYINILIFTKA